MKIIPQIKSRFYCRTMSFHTVFYHRKKKREWDRNRSFVRIRFRRPTSAQL